MGAWIEILLMVRQKRILSVAPLVGAWIEIEAWQWAKDFVAVAPLVGAWIEIKEIVDDNGNLPSLPLWERGLKW